MERCISYIGENATECVKTNAFLNLSREGIIKLISSDYVSWLMLRWRIVTNDGNPITVLLGRTGRLAVCLGMG